MTSTPKKGLPLYDDADSPDISTTGHYNAAMGKIDTELGNVDTTLNLHAKNIETLADSIGTERGERIAAIEKEAKARQEMDTSLAAAIENEKSERTKADDELLEKLKSAGISTVEIPYSDIPTDEDIALVKSKWPNVIAIDNYSGAIYLPDTWSDNRYTFYRMLANNITAKWTYTLNVTDKEWAKTKLSIAVDSSLLPNATESTHGMVVTSDDYDQPGTDASDVLTRTGANAMWKALKAYADGKAYTPAIYAAKNGTLDATELAQVKKSPSNVLFTYAYEGYTFTLYHSQTSATEAIYRSSPTAITATITLSSGEMSVTIPT